MEPWLRAVPLTTLIGSIAVVSFLLIYMNWIENSQGDCSFFWSSLVFTTKRCAHLSPPRFVHGKQSIFIIPAQMLINRRKVASWTIGVTQQHTDDLPNHLVLVSGSVDCIDKKILSVWTVTTTVPLVFVLCSDIWSWLSVSRSSMKVFVYETIKIIGRICMGTMFTWIIVVLIAVYSLAGAKTLFDGFEEGFLISTLVLLFFHRRSTCRRFIRAIRQVKALDTEVTFTVLRLIGIGLLLESTGFAIESPNLSNEKRSTSGSNVAFLRPTGGISAGEHRRIWKDRFHR